MTTSAADQRRRTLGSRADASLIPRARTYFASDSRRIVQTVLGVIWLLDGALQFQSFMYGKGFIQLLTSMTAGQPGWISSSVHWGASAMQSDQLVFNTLAGLTQVAIGIGLLYRPTVKVALAVSFAWALVVWWFGEAFGMLFMNMAQPLTGAPGAVLLYALAGLVVWPNGRPGGLLGVRGARAMWLALWLVMAWLWLLAPSSSANATYTSIYAAPSGMSWLSTLQVWVADAAKGNGLADRDRAGVRIGRDRDRGLLQLAPAAVPAARRRSEPRVLGPRPGLRRHLHGRRDGSECRTAVRPARVRDVRVDPIR